MVELQSSKLVTRVRFPSPAPKHTPGAYATLHRFPDVGASTAQASNEREKASSNTPTTKLNLLVWPTLAVCSLLDVTLYPFPTLTSSNDELTSL